MSRLIDADALFREMEKAQWYNNADRDEIAEELVLNAPTIEPRCEACEAFNKTRLLIPQPERKTGRWEIYVISMLDGEGCKCSECGFEGVPYWDFCPNCGAEMEGQND